MPPKQNSLVPPYADIPVSYTHLVEFCGYFPSDNPKYSIIVSINKKEIPASGGLMAGCLLYTS